MKAEDRIYPSNNEYDIPTLKFDMQPQLGLLLPFGGWGVTARLKTNIATYHFYVDDYRFENIWLRPERIIKSQCKEIIEPNFSLYQTTPIAYGIQQIYKKRWIARWLQEQGIRIYVDLNVAPKFRELNKLGVPQGYNAFATRGHKNELCQLEAEYITACELSGIDNPNMIVYGGGRDIQSYCKQKNLIYIDEYQVDRREKRKEVSNG